MDAATNEIDGKRTAPSVFLSYSREDQAKAQAIVAALEADGMTVWWDSLLEGGHAFAESIERALTCAEAVVVLWSPTSVRSHWVRDEAANGRDRGRMVPVTIGNAEPPLGFRQIHHIDFSSWRGRRQSREVEQLRRAIRTVAEGGGTEFETAPPRRRPALSRRQAIAGGAAAAVTLGAGAVAWTTLSGGGASASSIGILPFRNMSGDPEQDYFADGIAEELRATLSQNSDLAVAAQTSSEAIGRKSSNVRAIASTLGVGFLLEGSVRRASDMVRVVVQIVDGRTGFGKWSQTFDRKLDDILAVQSEIAEFVTDALLSGIMRRDRLADRIGGTRNTAAFDSYLRGVALYRLASGQADDEAALTQFEKAIEADPNYAVAQAARARSLTVIANSYPQAVNTRNYYQQAIDSARTAIRIAPNMAEGYSALGFVLLNGELDARAAAAPYRRSFALGYGNADVLWAYANFASRTGRFAEGRAAIARAQRLDPLNPTVFRTAGLLEFDARQYDAALAALQTALSLNPRSTVIHLTLGDIALLQGDAKAARAHYAQEPDTISRLRGLAVADMRLSNPAAAQAELAQLVRDYGNGSSYQQAQVLSQWGRKEDALNCLEKAIATHDAGVVRSKNDPLLDPIKKDVRFAKIQRMIGFV